MKSLGGKPILGKPVCQAEKFDSLRPETLSVSTGELGWGQRGQSPAQVARKSLRTLA